MSDRPLPVRMLAAPLIALALFGALLVPAGLTGQASAALDARRVGALAALPAHSRVLGTLVARARLTLDVMLAPRDSRGLAATAAAISDPASPAFRRYLTPAQLHARFGPRPAAITAVRHALVQAGLGAGTVSADGLLIHLHASVRQLSGGLHTSFVRVALADGRHAFTARVAPQFGGGVAGLIQGVIGLDDLGAPRAISLRSPRGVGHARNLLRRPRVVSGAAAPCATANSTATSYGAYTADTIAAAYGLSSSYSAGDLGAGQTVGMLEFEPFLQSDIQSYAACYGVSGAAANVSPVAVDGGAGTGAGQGEAALDIEQVVGLAPAAKVAVYEAPNSTTGEIDAFDAMLNNPAVRVISTSWGACEALTDASTARAETTVFNELAAAGKTVFGVTGDAGSTDCYGNHSPYDASLNTDDPGSQPQVTAVGGTSLPSAANLTSQTTWNDSSLSNGAGGGGVSSQFTMPAYQSGAASSLGVIGPYSTGTPCRASFGYCREVPDVSADADPQTSYVVYYSGSAGSPWRAMGGTSAAAPVWAALAALTNASSGCGGTPIGAINPMLYRLAASTPAAFTDITAGTTDYTPSGYTGGLYPATTGYDMATGLGTPRAATLIPALCAAGHGGGPTGTPNPSTTPAAGTSSGAAGSGATGSGATGSGATGSGATGTGATGTSATGTGTGLPGQTAPGTGGCVSTTVPIGGLSLRVGGHRRSAGAQRSLTLPPGCQAILNLVVSLGGRRPGAHGALRLQLRAGGRDLTLAGFSSRDAGRRLQRSIDLTPYAGSTVELLVRASGHGRGTATFGLSGLTLTESN